MIRDFSESSGQKIIPQKQGGVLDDPVQEHKNEHSPEITAPKAKGREKTLLREPVENQPKQDERKEHHRIENQGMIKKGAERVACKQQIHRPPSAAAGAVISREQAEEAGGSQLKISFNGIE